MYDRCTKAGWWLMAIGWWANGCTERAATDVPMPDDTGGAGGTVEAGGAGASAGAAGAAGASIECPTHADECPEECVSVSVREIVPQGDTSCLGPSEVVGCDVPPEGVRFDIGCVVSADGTFVRAGGSSANDLFLALHHGYRSCEEGEHDYLVDLPSCEE